MVFSMRGNIVWDMWNLNMRSRPSAPQRFDSLKKEGRAMTRRMGRNFRGMRSASRRIEHRLSWCLKMGKPLKKQVSTHGKVSMSLSMESTLAMSLWSPISTIRSMTTSIGPRETRRSR
jgi:hypothetical protein